MDPPGRIEDDDAAAQEATTVRSTLDEQGSGVTAARGGLIRVVGYGAGLLLSVGYLPLLIRHLGLDEFGRYTAAMAVVGISAGAVDFGIRDSAVRELASKRPDGIPLSTMLDLRLRTSLAGWGAGMLIGVALSYHSDLLLGIGVAGLGQILNNVQSVIAAPLSADLRLRTTTLLDLGQQILLVVLTVGALIEGWGLTAFFWVQLIAPAPSLAITAFLMRQELDHAGRSTRHGLRALSRTLPFAVVALLTTVYLRLAVLVTSVASTATQTGYLGTSFRVVEALIYVPSVLTAAMFPALTRYATANRERFQHATTQTFEAMLLLGTATFVVIFAGAPLICHVLAGHGYRHVTPVLRIQALVLPSSFVIAWANYTLFAQHRHRHMIIAVGCGLALNAALLVALVSSQGAQGAAVATAAGEAAIALAAAVAAVRVDRLTLSTRTVVAVVVAGAAGATPSLVGLPSWLSLMLGVAAFVSVIVCGHAVPTGLRALVSRT